MMLCVGFLLFTYILFLKRYRFHYVMLMVLLGKKEKGLSVCVCVCVGGKKRCLCVFYKGLEIDYYMFGCNLFDFAVFSKVFLLVVLR